MKTWIFKLSEIGLQEAQELTALHPEGASFFLIREIKDSLRIGEFYRTVPECLKHFSRTSIHLDKEIFESISSDDNFELLAVFEGKVTNSKLEWEIPEHMI